MTTQGMTSSTVRVVRGRIVLGAVGMVAAMLVGPGVEEALGQQNLRPGVRPGEVIILREVEPAAFGQSDRVGGPIRARADLRRNTELNETVTQETQRQLSGVRAVALTDARAAGISSGKSLGMPQLHRGLGTDAPGYSSAARSGQAAGSLGGGSVGGGVVGITSGLADTVKGALSPLTGER